MPRALFESTSEPESESESGWTPRNARDLRLPIMVLVDSDAKTRPLSLSDTVVQPIVLVTVLSGLYRPCRCQKSPSKLLSGLHLCWVQRHSGWFSIDKDAFQKKLSGLQTSFPAPQCNARDFKLAGWDTVGITRE
jgi:hypothetical protein